MSLEHAILGCLSRHSMSGYELKRELQHAAGSFWTVDQAHVYRTLERCAKRGLVRSRRIRQRTRPDRREWSLTPAGTDHLEGLCVAIEALPPLRDPFMLRLLYSEVASDPEIAAFLGNAREQHQRRLDGLRDQIAAVAREHGVPSRAAALRRMALDGAIAAERSSVDWLDDCLEQLRSGLPRT